MDHNSKVIIEQNQIIVETTVAPVDIVTIGMQGPSGGSGSGGGAVSSVNGQTGAVNLSASDVGAATSEQGAKADSALQPSDVSTAGKTGSYNDLTNKPDLTLKQNSLPTTGTEGQFLAHDLTFKTPSGGGSNRIINANTVQLRTNPFTTSSSLELMTINTPDNGIYEFDANYVLGARTSGSSAITPRVYRNNNIGFSIYSTPTPLGSMQARSDARVIKIKGKIIKNGDGVSVTFMFNTTPMGANNPPTYHNEYHYDSGVTDSVKILLSVTGGEFAGLQQVYSVTEFIALT